MKNIIVSGLAAILATGLAGAAHAGTVSLGGTTFDGEDAAGIEVTSGAIETFDVGSTGSAGSIGGSVLDGLRCDAGGCTFDIVFGSGIRNGEGDDLLLVGLGGSSTSSIRELFTLSANGNSLTDIELADTGEMAGGFTVRALGIDLSDLGVAANDFVTRVTIAVNAGVNAEEFSVALALNSAADLETPLPAAAWLFGSAVVAGGLAKRKRNKATA